MGSRVLGASIGGEKEGGAASKTSPEKGVAPLRESGATASSATSSTSVLKGTAASLYNASKNVGSRLIGGVKGRAVDKTEPAPNNDSTTAPDAASEVSAGEGDEQPQSQNRSAASLLQSGARKLFAFRRS